DDDDEDEEDEEDSYGYVSSSDDYVDPLGADLSDYDDYTPEAGEQDEAPRSWWQKVGEKLGFAGRDSANGSSDHEPIRERAEPVIGNSSFDTLVSAAPAAAAAADPERRESNRRRSRDRDLDPRRQQERDEAQTQPQTGNRQPQQQPQQSQQ